jgi:hypothetical protein
MHPIKADLMNNLRGLDIKKDQLIKAATPAIS